MPLFDGKDKSRYAAFTRRTLMTGGAIGAVLGALGVRLYQLQILEGDQFRTKAEENSVSARLVAPLRVLDWLARNVGKPLFATIFASLGNRAP